MFIIDKSARLKKCKEIFYLCSVTDYFECLFTFVKLELRL
jgi:hypothetical protein